MTAPAWTDRRRIGVSEPAVAVTVDDDAPVSCRTHASHERERTVLDCGVVTHTTEALPCLQAPLNRRASDGRATGYCNVELRGISEL